MQSLVLLTALTLLVAGNDHYEPESTHAPTPPAPDGSITVSGGVAALGIGFLWGHGTLSYQGRPVGFRVRGMDIGDLAAARVRAYGLIYHLTCLADFAGTYTAASAGAAILKGQSAAVMQNEHGVVIEIESSLTGLRFNLAASRLRVVLDASTPCSR
jgi:hypothetical protein